MDIEYYLARNKLPDGHHGKISDQNMGKLTGVCNKQAQNEEDGMENTATKTENRPTSIRIIKYRRGWEFRYRNGDGDMVTCARPYASAHDAAQALACHLESIEEA